MTRLIDLVRGQSLGALALFVALGGTSYAAIKLPTNSVKAKQIAAGAVTGSEIKNGSIGSADIKNGSLTASDLATGLLGSGGGTGTPGAAGTGGATGAAGSTGALGPAGPAGPAGAIGPVGPAGAKGETGATGPAGAKGETGTTGATGATGAAGNNGTNGTNGTNGAPGAPGADGTARAFAFVDPTTCGPGLPVVCTAARAKGVTSVIRTAVGRYCVAAPGLSPATTPALASVDFSTSANPETFVSAQWVSGASCPNASDYRVATQRANFITVRNAADNGGEQVADDNDSDSNAVGFVIVIP